MPWTGRDDKDSWKRAEAYADQLARLTARHGCVRYLRDHALADKDVLRKFHLGYVDEPLDEQETMYRGRLVIPYVTRRGIIGCKYRCVHHYPTPCEGHQKTYWSGGPARIYNTLALHGPGFVIGIAEGEPDAMAATRWLCPTIGVPGVKTWTQNRDHWRYTLDDFDRVIVWAQGDSDGHDLGQAIKQDLGPRVLVIETARGEDVASTLAKDGGADELLRRARIVN